MPIVSRGCEIQFTLRSKWISEGWFSSRVSNPTHSCTNEITNTGVAHRRNKPDSIQNNGHYRSPSRTNSQGAFWIPTFKSSKCDRASTSCLSPRRTSSIEEHQWPFGTLNIAGGCWLESHCYFIFPTICNARHSQIHYTIYCYYIQ